MEKQRNKKFERLADTLFELIGLEDDLKTKLGKRGYRYTLLLFGAGYIRNMENAIGLNHKEAEIALNLFKEYYPEIYKTSNELKNALQNDYYRASSLSN